MRKASQVLYNLPRPYGSKWYTTVHPDTHQLEIIQIWSKILLVLPSVWRGEWDLYVIMLWSSLMRRYKTHYLWLYYMWLNAQSPWNKLHEVVDKCLWRLLSFLFPAVCVLVFFKINTLHVDEGYDFSSLMNIIYYYINTFSQQHIVI